MWGGLRDLQSSRISLCDIKPRAFGLLGARAWRMLLSTWRDCSYRQQGKASTKCSRWEGRWGL